MTEPTPTFALSHDLVEAVCALSPITATFAGVAGHEHRWDDVSPEGQDARAAMVADFTHRLAALPPTDDPDDALAQAVLGEYLAERTAFYGSDDRYLDLNNITSTFQCFPMAFDAMDAESPEGREAVEARLAALPEAMERYRALLQEGLRRGAAVSRRQVEAAVAQGRAQAALYHGTAARAGRPPEAGEAAALALAALTDWLERAYLPGATPADGVGREAYARAARQHLGKTLDLKETYAWGFEEIRRIDVAMAELARSIAPGVAVDALARRLDDPTTGEGLALPEPFLTAMRERQSRALDQLAGTHFDVPEPIRRLDVKLAPAGGKVGAYYMPPSEDFSRPGCIWYAPGTLATMPLWQQISTAYHEGFPGHHLQIGLQLHRKAHLSRFQRVLAVWPGAAEGWALYAEQLMLELGYFERPAYAFGMYAAQLMRAARVVVDIGLHLGLTIPGDFDFHPGEPWSYSLAVAMMHERSFMPLEQAESDVVRYLGWPAQAIAYKVGQRVVLHARQTLVTEGGLPLRTFHQRVLDLGSVGLATLEASLGLASPER